MRNLAAHRSIGIKRASCDLRLWFESIAKRVSVVEDDSFPDASSRGPQTFSPTKFGNPQESGLAPEWEQPSLGPVSLHYPGAILHDETSANLRKHGVSEILWRFFGDLR